MMRNAILTHTPSSIRAWGRRHVKPLTRLRRRFRQAVGPYAHLPTLISSWLLNSNEIANYSYDLSARNEEHLAWMVSLVTKTDVALIRAYFAEARETVVPPLSEGVASYRALRREAGNCYLDPVIRIGRRIGWYAVVRVLKPRLVVETGVDHGFGSVTICAALRQNAHDGHPGRYVGTDIDPEAGSLFGPEWRTIGEIAFGDSIDTLRQLAGPIDLFINDSDHSAEYEGREYQVVQSKLSPHAFIIGDNAHVTDELSKFSQAADRQFLFFREVPDGHWYPGAGIGFSFPARSGILRRHCAQATLGIDVADVQIGRVSVARRRIRGVGRFVADVERDGTRRRIRNALGGRRRHSPRNPPPMSFLSWRNADTCETIGKKSRLTQSPKESWSEW